jgi:hypothetical protein
MSVPRLHNEDQLPLGGRLETTEEDFGVRWPPVYEDMSPEAEERPLLEAATKLHSEDRESEHYSV